MAKHNSGGRSRHFISRPLVALTLALILAAGLVTAWRQLGDRIDDEPAITATGECLEGPATASILADPGIAPALQKIAEDYNKTKPVIRDHCMTVEVRPADARATLEGLTAPTWDAQIYGEFPTAWVPQSSIWAAALQTANAEALQGKPESLVSSPIRLAMEPEIAKAGADALAWSICPHRLERIRSPSSAGVRGARFGSPCRTVHSPMPPLLAHRPSPRAPFRRRLPSPRLRRVLPP